MAMNAVTMATAVVNALKALNPELTGAAEVKAQEQWEAICGAIVAHVQANAAVSSAGATGTGPAGGPLPINALPGVIT